MKDYWQPEFYSFTQDSIELAKFVSNKILDIKIQTVLDLGCGCGVVGIELLRERKERCHLYSIDSEISFQEYYDKNVETFIPNHHSQFINVSFKDFRPQLQYDCIVSNPPYFDSQAGRPNPNPRTNHARRWTLADQKSFLSLFLNLNLNGQGFFLSRSPIEDWQRIIEVEKLKLKLEEVYKVAGAQIFTVSSFE